MRQSLLKFSEFNGISRTFKGTVMICHGLFGSSKNWKTFGKRLSNELARKVVAVDLRNHGNSFWTDELDYLAMGKDLITLAKTMDGPIDLIGHSMGGKAAMSACLLKGNWFRKLLVVDIAPITYQESVFEDYINGLQKIQVEKLKSREQADKFLQELIPNADVRALLLQNLLRTQDGFFWTVNLKALKNNLSQILAFPHFRNEFSGETLLIKGQQSSYITKKGFSKMRMLFPHFEFLEILDSGHWPHIDQPRIFQLHVKRFLTRRPD